MQFFNNLSINAKLSLSTLLACGAALILVSAALIFNDYHLLRDSKIDQLTALAKVLGDNCSAALNFKDQEAAKGSLLSLKSQNTIRFACIYDADGNVFATYKNQDETSEFSFPPLGPAGHQFVSGGYLDVRELIIDNKERIGSVYFRSSISDLNEQLSSNVITVAIVMVLAIAMVFFFSTRLQRAVSRPILDLARIAQHISKDRDFSARVKKVANDELGTLYDEFNAMLDQTQRYEAELQRAHDQLEIRVQQRTRELSESNLHLNNEIAEREKAEAELETVHKQLVEAARRAGMAEVATGVLHNVGNVLNSINVSTTLIGDRLRNARLFDLTRALDLMTQHTSDLGEFITQDERGKRIPGFLNLVVSHMSRDHATMLEELGSLTKNVDHIKTIVAMQQTYAGAAGLVESISLAELADDAIRLNATSFDKYRIVVIREYADIPNVRIEKQKVLQILMNLVTNAKDAILESMSEERRLVVRIHVKENTDKATLLIEVQDSGVGIPKENLQRVFSHGFTTKRHGHGFGLHSSANAAKELGGALKAQSDGPGCGATFTLELPYKPVEVLT
jgi:two-component system, NtrC family, sensor kinase